MKKVSFMNDPSFGDNPKVTPLLETPFSKEIRICMSKGNMMKEHTAPGAITIMLLKGKLLLESQGHETILEDGDIVYLNPKIPHSLEAIEECIIRLTLARHDSVERINKIIAPLGSSQK
ncbi:cupin domain-containing protein [Sulfurovum sp. zt1-1]|uniref:Cupin domain-containing protein n=1 Tax=Sulfurovum zhangzhouensis TaxID=3019067 RepID=A0ABT7QXE1_9BACT|nr:cupin domain-containing protein [Sulfurovum zhangzhouensis]MDM5271502.1 cupin domain-containing protein [Sulfurovum zhangzhouensis]